jgi:antitoxin CptB
MSDSMTAEAHRLLWRCRRGMLELDLLLENFVREQYAHLSPGQIQSLDSLLDYPDNELWDLVTGKQQSGDKRLQDILSLLQQVRIS